MIFRDYDPEKDKDAAHRIWNETGWLKLDNKSQIEAMDILVGCGRAMVAEIRGAAECLVIAAPATLRHGREDLPFAIVTGVTTSRVARLGGLASRLTARMVARLALDGAVACGLGIFDQGYYDRLGFGSEPYHVYRDFDPAHLTVERLSRSPERFGLEDWQALHEARLRRLRGHGAVNALPPEATRADMLWSEHGFGLGWRDGEGGAISHCLWCEAPDNAEHGPYRVGWMAFQNYAQFRELMSLLKSLGDQVHSIGLIEPPGVQIQDLLARPFKHIQSRINARFALGTRAESDSQLRVCDVAGCLARTRAKASAPRFNLSIEDPIERHLDDDAEWKGIGGDYVVELGQRSGAERGHDPQAPILRASAGAFSRLWIGALSASALAATDRLSAPPELLEALDEALCFPRPARDWQY